MAAAADSEASAAPLPARDLRAAQTLTRYVKCESAGRIAWGPIVSHVSRYVTLGPGDVIFTGTPGTTQAMRPGDTFEVEIEGIGVLRNTVVAGRR